MVKKSDDWILSSLKSVNNERKDQALREIYRKIYPDVKRYVLNNSGSSDEASDIFQDAVIVFYTQMAKGELKLHTSLKSYIMAICKNLWLNVLRRKRKHTGIEEIPEQYENETIDILLKSEEQKAIARAMSKLGEGCQRILSLYYFERMKMKQIAQTMNLGSEQSAKNKKSKCLKKLRAICQEMKIKNTV